MRILILNIIFATKRFFSTETLIAFCDSYRKRKTKEFTCQLAIYKNSHLGEQMMERDWLVDHGGGNNYGVINKKKFPHAF